jgi:predicted aminopeptidase
VPLEDLLERGGEDREFAERVEDIRRFAVEDLGLQGTKNYTRYVELDRDYLAAVVNASAPDSFTTHEWWFPVVGKVPYKGFFNPEDARKEAETLRDKGLDVWIRRVDAFSTLGWFRDPLYSYMKDYSVRDLANLIIHESLHATVYLKNHAQFNESLAEFVGTEGARLYMEKTLGAGTVEAADLKAEEARGDRAAFIAFIRSLIDRLEEVYRGDLSREEKLARKGEIIAGAQEDFARDYDRLFKTENYRRFPEIPVNNAYLDLYRLYYEGDDFFQRLYERTGRNLRAFIEGAKTLRTSRKGDPREELEQALAACCTAGES